MATILDESIAGGRGYGFGGGMIDGGGGLGGGLLLGLLLGRGGLGGFGGYGNDNRRDCGECVTNESLNQQTLGDIKAAIPLAEAQVQLAMAGLQASLSAQATSDTQYLSQGQTAIQLAQQATAAALARDIAAVDTNVDRTACATQNAIKDSERNILEVINQNRIRDLEQQLTVSQLRESEQRAINRENVNSHNTNVTVNQAQAQQQLQNQRMEFALNSLLSGFGQIARATNSQVVVGSTGVAGTQTANPTNVNA